MIAFLLDETTAEMVARFLAKQFVRVVAMGETFTPVRKDCKSITITSPELKKKWDDIAREIRSSWCDTIDPWACEYLIKALNVTRNIDRPIHSQLKYLCRIAEVRTVWHLAVVTCQVLKKISVTFAPCEIFRYSINPSYPTSNMDKLSRIKVLPTSGHVARS